MSALYFDDDEEGLARETSHPFFVEHATADFYYDCTDDFSPFGNDAGADILYRLEDWYREKAADAKAATFLRSMITDNWDFGATYLELTDTAQLSALSQEDRMLYGEIDQTVIATAFGQYKIAGTADKLTLNMAAKAFLRQRYLAEIGGQHETRPWAYADQYLARLDSMEADLAAMVNKKAR